MRHVLPLFISNEIRRELQQRAVLRLAVEWIAVTWLLHGLHLGAGMQWLLTSLATPLVACLLAPALGVCHAQVNHWLQALDAWALTRLSQALLLVMELLTLACIARLLSAWLS